MAGKLARLDLSEQPVLNDLGDVDLWEVLKLLPLGFFIIIGQKQSFANTRDRLGPWLPVDQSEMGDVELVFGRQSVMHGPAGGLGPVAPALRQVRWQV